MFAISALPSTLSGVAFWQQRILPLIGKQAWNSESLTALIDDPAESPSTMYNSHLDLSFLFLG